MNNVVVVVVVVVVASAAAAVLLLIGSVGFYIFSYLDKFCDANSWSVMSYRGLFRKQWTNTVLVSPRYTGFHGM